jgi:large subunit ribosomal protein L3
MKGLIGKKVGMTQIFDESGAAIPVTVIEAGPCYVTQVRTVDKDGYAAVQLGFEEVETRKLTGGRLGHLKKYDLPTLKYLKEFRTKEEVEEGQKFTVDVFADVDRVDVIGKSKGKGFAGVVKRYGFAGGPKTHGQSDRLRAPGSIGATSTPGRVFKGKRMPGRMGNQTVTAQNLEVSLVNPEKNLIAVRGSVPGPKGGLVVIKEARKN